MRALAAVLLVACAAEPTAPEPVPAVEIRAWLEGVGDNAGQLALQVEADKHLSVSISEPTAQGLTLSARGEPVVERLGDRTVVTSRFVFEGSPGHYEIEPVVVRWLEGDRELEVASSPLFVDLAVQPPRPAELVDLVEPTPVFPVPWVALGVGAALGSGGLALALALRRRRAPEIAVSALPPHLAALKAWEAVRADPGLDDLQRAVAISRIFREYAEAALRFPATTRTSAEILDHLGGLPLLPPGSLGQAGRLLRATDLVKYADEGGGEALFEGLDADLRGFVDSTRPRAMEPA